MVVFHPQVDRSVSLADEILAYLAQWPACSAIRVSIESPEAQERLPECDMMVVLGGDGSMLRAARLAATQKIPILGVNLGRLGFLGEVQPDGWQAVLARVLQGDYWLETRAMLHVEHQRDGQPVGAYSALNEAVVGRGALARPVRLKTMVDGGDLTTYVADGLIVATATGSTAYAMAAGGPILPPTSRSILLIAIAPHLSLDHAIVLEPGATVEVVVRTDHQAILSADGQVEVPLLDKDLVRVRMNNSAVRLVRVRPPTYFYTSLMERMAHNPAADKNK
jgi:NAD+ kinase